MYRPQANDNIADLMKIIISQNEKVRRASDVLSKAHIKDLLEKLDFVN